MKPAYRLLILATTVLALAGCQTSGPIAAKPLYRDPVYDGAADPTIVWNRLGKARGLKTRSIVDSVRRFIGEDEGRCGAGHHDVRRAKIEWAGGVARRAPGPQGRRTWVRKFAFGST